MPNSWMLFTISDTRMQDDTIAVGRKNDKRKKERVKKAVDRRSEKKLKNLKWKRVSDDKKRLFLFLPTNISIGFGSGGGGVILLNVCAYLYIDRDKMAFHAA